MEFCPQVATVGFPETTPKEVGRERRKANRVGISFKIFCNMKKIFLLLAFAFCANVAFANVVTSEHLIVEKLSAGSCTTNPEAGCILCVPCRGLLLCVTAGTCETAAALLAVLWEVNHCEGSGSEPG